VTTTAIVAYDLRPGGGEAVTTWTDVADTVQAFVTAGGIVVGGVFTYYKFVKDRIYRPRLDLQIDSDRIRLGDRHYLLCQLSVQNKGATKLSLMHDGIALIVRSGAVDQRPLHTARWSDIENSAVVDVFAKHDWIESTETIRDSALVSVDSDESQAYRLELRIVVQHPSPRSRENISIYGAHIDAGGAWAPGSDPSTCVKRGDDNG
jgi:hypothetical protein